MNKVTFDLKKLIIILFKGFADQIEPSCGPKLSHHCDRLSTVLVQTATSFGRSMHFVLYKHGTSWNSTSDMLSIVTLCVRDKLFDLENRDLFPEILKIYKSLKIP